MSIKYSPLNQVSLYPCPCCGSMRMNVKINLLNDPRYNYIQCDHCGINTGLKDSLTEAVDTWNKRFENTTKIYVDVTDEYMWD